jgi:tetratricopeptide (TPR) repeat protein
MGSRMSKLKRFVAAIFLSLTSLPALAADDALLDELFTALRKAEGEIARQIEAKIWAEWSRSGSPAIDLLLERGRRALEAGQTELALAHFSSIVDHAPQFAEGWNMRATAHYQNGRFGQSLSDIRMTLALNPRHFGAMTGLASILEQLGEADAALEAWRAVEDINPSSPAVGEAIERLERRTGGETL